MPNGTFRTSVRARAAKRVWPVAIVVVVLAANAATGALAQTSPKTSVQRLCPLGERPEGISESLVDG